MEVSNMAKKKGWKLDDSSLEPYKIEPKKQEAPKTEEEESKNVQKPKKL